MSIRAGSAARNAQWLHFPRLRHTIIIVPEDRGATPMRIRKNVKHLSAAEKGRFVDAVLALKAVPSVLHPGDPVLRRYDDYAEMHMNAMMASPGWAHRRPAFFPWHRVMVLQFENDL